MISSADYLRFFLSLIGSALFVYVAAPLFMKLAFRLSIIDEPGGRKIHSTAIPLLGGLAIYAGLMIGIATNLCYLKRFAPFIIALTIIFLLGLIDDIRGLGARIRLGVQTIASLVIILTGTRVSFLPDCWWGDLLEILITLVWLLGITNAFNYLDGMDGLATGSAVLNLYFFTNILFTTGQYGLALLAGVAIGPCLGFLPHNFPRARMFLGDAGSTLLGFFIASIAIMGTWAGDNAVRLTVPIIILGVPIFDMTFTTIMRIRDKKIHNVVEWLKYAGRDHFHHYLVELGLRRIDSVLAIYLVTISLGLAGLMLSNDDVSEAILTLSQTAVTFLAIAMVIVAGRHHRDGWDK